MFARLNVPEDEDAVVELARMQVAETLPHLTFNEARTRATFQRSIKTASPTIFVVEENRTVIAYLVAFAIDYAMADGQYACQDVIYVRPDKRGTRAAAQLLKIFGQWADRIDAEEVFTGISNGYQPERTSRFMQHFGYTPVGINLRRVRKVETDV